VEDLPAAVRAVMVDKHFVGGRLAGYDLPASAD
jgi:hypothetical protein